MDALETDFERAVQVVRNAPPNAGPNKLTDEQRLRYYGLYKQATEGDNDSPKPWGVQVQARAKWEAWNKLRGTSKQQAMVEYIRLVNQRQQQSAAQQHK